MVVFKVYFKCITFFKFVYCYHISCSVCSQKLVYLKAHEYEIIENFRLVGVINWQVLCNLHQ